EYDENTESIKTKVKAAKRILLYVHGIFGDTSAMLPSVLLAKAAAGKTVRDHYDLVLACDYENLNTPIGDTANELKKALAAVGLKADHGKQLHVVAHSMGGLVARSFIEAQQGNRVVQWLVMLGTPNGGSPWPSVHALALFGLSTGLSALTGS